jgi:hypothetical protein
MMSSYPTTHLFLSSCNNLDALIANYFFPSTLTLVLPALQPMNSIIESHFQIAESLWLLSCITPAVTGLESALLVA